MHKKKTIIIVNDIAFICLLMPSRVEEYMQKMNYSIIGVNMKQSSIFHDNTACYHRRPIYNHGKANKWLKRSVGLLQN